MEQDRNFCATANRPVEYMPSKLVPHDELILDNDLSSPCVPVIQIPTRPAEVVEN